MVNGSFRCPSGSPASVLAAMNGPTLSVKGQIDGNILGFVGHMVSVATVLLCMGKHVGSVKSGQGFVLLPFISPTVLSSMPEHKAVTLLQMQFGNLLKQTGVLIVKKIYDSKILIEPYLESNGKLTYCYGKLCLSHVF